MLKPLISEILTKALEGSQCEIFGWVKSKRTSKNVAFVVVNDGSQQKDLQVVVDANLTAFSLIDKVQTGAALHILGKLSKSPGKGQDWEVIAQEIEVLGNCDAEIYPLQKKGHSLEFLREIGHLRARTNTFGAVFRVRNTLAQLVHEYFQAQQFVWVHTPIITASDCEGAGEMFRVTHFDLAKVPVSSGQVNYAEDFFGKPAHLTVSGQLEGEALACALSRVYTFGPTFRAENSNTSRHLAEFWMIEPEVAFADLAQDAQLAESFIRFVLAGIAQRCPAEIEFFAKFYKSLDAQQLQQLAEKQFTKITYTEAVEVLLQAKVDFEFPVKWGIDLQSEHERYLTDQVYQGPVIVTDYPKGIKAFYMRQNDDGKTVAAMDVLMPKVGELIGGSQREERLDRLEARMLEMGLLTSETAWYLDLRRFGTVPHAGFGLGFERLVQYVTGMGNIRDVIPFPRAPGLIDF